MVSYDINQIFKFFPEIVKAVPLTIGILTFTILLGSLLGGFLALGQLSDDPFFIKTSKTYIFIIRCTPPIVLLFLVFYGLPEFLNWWLGVNINGWSRAIFVLIAMTLLYAASISEVFKSAYLAVPKGQLEAGLSIGLTTSQTIYRIILPQALRFALPNISNAILNLLKDSALAYTIGLADVMGTGNLLIGRNLGNYSLEIYTAVAIIYWALAMILTYVNHRLENFLDTSKA